MLTGHSVCFAYGNGHELFKNIQFSLDNKKYALVGVNGIGKSTLALLMAGKIAPTTGNIHAHGIVSYFAQNEIPSGESVAEYLADIWETCAGVESFVHKLLQGQPLEQKTDSLSGGEWMKVRLARALSLSWDLLILDEPTNNLDNESIDLIVQLLHEVHKPVLVISHDRKILRHVDEILELSNLGLQVYGGNFDFYLESREKEQKRQEVEAVRLKNNTKKRHIEKAESIQKQEKRTRVAKKKAPDMGMPKILLGARKRQAQLTAAKVLIQEDKLVDNSTEALRLHRAREKLNRLIYFEMPETSFPHGKLLLNLQDFNFRYPEQTNDLWTPHLNLSVRGPVRLAIRGANGSGKSTLLNLLKTQFSHSLGVVKGYAQFSTAPQCFIDQNYTSLDARKTVIENVVIESSLDPASLRNNLSRFLFQGDQVYQKVDTLSGGERIRLCLAQSLLKPVVPQILVLDEPTNNLDLKSIEYLEKILKQYNGALIVVSHDEDFLRNIGCLETLNLGYRPCN